jgi:tRNA-Thr(GGU) m(6)t(6)A37 methyltransferase TsaA
MAIYFKAIGSVHTEAREIPRHHSVSEVEGWLDLLPEYEAGLSDIEPGQKIVVLFHFHRSPAFEASLLRQTPPHRDGPMGVFSICSPRRPNAIGMSIVEVLDVNGVRIHVKGLDTCDGTPILDIKPYFPPEAGRRH